MKVNKDKDLDILGLEYYNTRNDIIFSKLYDVAFKSGCSFIYNYFKHNNIPSKDIVEEIVSGALLNVYKYIDTYKPHYRFSVWYFQILKNGYKYYFKRNKTHYNLPINEKLLSSEDIQPSFNDLILEKYPTIEDMLVLVDEDHIKKLMTLHYVHQIPLKKLSEILDISENTIKTRLRKGRLKLKQLLAP